MHSTVAGGLIGAAEFIVIAFFLVRHTAGAALLLGAMAELWHHWDPAEDEALRDVLTSEALPTVSVVITGHAAREWIVESVRASLALHYPRHEVVLVHDGEASGFLPAIIASFDLYQVPPAVLVNVPTGPVRGYYRSRRHGKLFLIDKARVGHADDLNAALNASRFPYILAVDVGTRLEPDALPRLMRPFLLGQRIAAVAAGARIGGGRLVGGDVASVTHEPRGWLSGMHALERLRVSVFLRLGWNRLGGQLPARGDVLLHRRDHLLEIDGFRTGPVDPELDLVVRLREHLRAQQLPDVVPAIPDSVVWEIAPASARAIGERHAAAQRGRIEQLFARGVGGRRAGGRTSDLPTRIALGAALVAPILEGAGYLLCIVALARDGWRDPFLAAFLVAVPGYSLLLSMWAVVMEQVAGRRQASWRDTLRLGGLALCEQVGYRQWIMWRRLRATALLVGRRRSEPERASSTGVEEPSATARARAR